ncbi:hypothetical protein CH298_16590 [Rhodococcoides fascians]|uniref:DUF4190 domain-containing protein n=1 Tax=Rhodococcoides fascians TaxID=1828 RepID=UPI000B9B5845|nr:DUF4190 domain-containing protein [Rhodococcus fascians]OZE88842.1 hypothetical protein CH303_16470 [Rhodococcus fascians]OZF16803.1 hypothetical protein CH298_16590 [Rhodococcus fascians]OZF19822.1 hypothetical protein CH297_16490 [Rhodococcus fascians]OZF66086.1 hypothetical protein CH308_16390 [Rhodococcus fascians]OZF69239.1 hypothetical protein CH307_16585 [Rhodococcus fascians]
MTVDLTEGDNRATEPVNPYAVISLVAALLGLFPVAIVFGILAFWRPAGRGIAVAGLAIGVIELLVVATVVYGFGSLTPSTPASVETIVPYSLPATALFTVPPTTEPPTPVETTVDATGAPSAALPEVDGPCDPGVDNHGTSADGTFLKCTYAGSTRAHWVQSAPIIDGNAEAGSECDPAARGIALSPDGFDMFCVSDGANGGGYWSPGP